MAASATIDNFCVSNIHIVVARCTGFAKIKGTQNEFEFCIDLEWSDERCMSIKRTYNEFRRLHTNLLKLFPELKQTAKSKLNLQTSIKENVANLFSKDKGNLAETREQILDVYLQCLLRQPDRIRRSNVVITYFEPRESDPKPCKNTSPGEKSDSGIDLSTGRNNSTQSGSNHPPVFEPRVGYDEDYDGDSSSTEEDNDPFDDEYMLDFGFGELMLHDSTDNLELNRSGNDASWCSNTSKLSNILTALPPQAYNQSQKSYMQTLDGFGEDDFKDIEDSFLRESSDTESQMFASQIDPNFSDGLESDDEFSCSKVAPNDMKHYYLSTNTSDAVESAE